jgi:trigger factor
MQVKIEDVSPVEKKLIVEIPWETVSTRLGDAYRELGKGVQLKGFRKGKVPRSVLEQMYGPRVHAEVAYQLVRESFFTATAEHKIAAVAEPRVEAGAEVKKGQPFTYEAIVEVKGEVVPGDYDAMPIERRRLAVTDEAVDAAIEQLRREHTELKPVEGRTETQPGDVLALSITGEVGEHAINQPRFGLDLDDPEREPLPGLAAAMIGVPIDTRDKVVELEVPEDWRDESLRGRKARLVVTVVDVRAKEVPELDDEFAKDTGKGETLDELRAAVRKELEERETETIQNETRQAALRELVKRNPIPVAASLVERGVEVQFNRLRQMLGIEGPPKGQRYQIPGEVADRLRPAAADEVRGQLLLEAIAEREAIAVGDDELDAHVANAARLRSTAVGRLRAEWQKDGRLDSARWQLRQQKVLDHLVARAQVTEVDQLTEPVDDTPQVEPEAVAAAGHEPEGHVHGPDCDHDHDHG